MTPEQQAAWLHDPDRCPFCGTVEIEEQPGFEWISGREVVVRVVFCRHDDCSRQWRDIYTLTGVEDADDQPPRVGVKVS
jgi:hypothetical protein